MAGLPSSTRVVIENWAKQQKDRPSRSVDVRVVDGRVITLSRNLDHQKAIAIGLAYSVANNLADVFVVMDADGEDRPGDVPRLLAALESGPELSVVVARRMKRSERLVPGHADPIEVAHHRIAHRERETLSGSVTHEFCFTHHAWLRCGINLR
jgi:glycosyltransferase involved in cell wall biosynthesis